jgi:hypothetical protein
MKGHGGGEGVALDHIFKVFFAGSDVSFFGGLLVYILHVFGVGLGGDIAGQGVYIFLGGGIAEVYLYLYVFFKYFRILAGVEDEPAEYTHEEEYNGYPQDGHKIGGLGTLAGRFTDLGHKCLDFIS